MLKSPTDVKMVHLQDMAERSEGYTGADLAAVVREAALAALTDSLQAAIVASEHFDRAFKASMSLALACKHPAERQCLQSLCFL